MVTNSKLPGDRKQQMIDEAYQKMTTIAERVLGRQRMAVGQ